MPILPGSTIGILGGGQLGRMTAMAARSYGYRVQVLDPDPSCPARFVVDACFEATWDDATEAAALARGCDVITLEIEQVAISSINAAAKYAPVRPGANVLQVIQDRIAQRAWLVQHGFPVGDHRAVTTGDQLAAALRDFSNDVFIKAARGGYDGRAQLRLTPEEAAKRGVPSGAPATETLARNIFENDFRSHPVIVEKALNLEEEISVLVVRRPSGETVAYPPAMNHHVRQILEWSVLPAQLPPDITRRATEIATSLAHQFNLEGLLVAELFLTKSGELLVNELAPRPHNSYHQSERACVTSQFEQHVRAVCDLPLGSAQIIRPAAIVNLLGDLWLGGSASSPASRTSSSSSATQNPNSLSDSGTAVHSPNFAAALEVPEVRLHLYEKHVPKAARKMGHLSASADTPEEAVRRVLEAKRRLVP
jgi:5-(carboxyamino)imidazole ribonucleotide synthase